MNGKNYSGRVSEMQANETLEMVPSATIEQPITHDNHKTKGVVVDCAKGQMLELKANGQMLVLDAKGHEVEAYEH